MLENNNIKLRNVVLFDSYDIWKWRNDRKSRKNFRKSNYVEWKDHSKWFEDTIKEKRTVLFLAYNIISNTKIGVIRFDFDKSKNEAEVSININPLMRRKGYSYQLLNSSIQRFLINNFCKIFAEIKSSNISSIKSFTKVGFVLVGKRKEIKKFINKKKQKRLYKQTNKFIRY